MKESVELVEDEEEEGRIMKEIERETNRKIYREELEEAGKRGDLKPKGVCVIMSGLL